MSAREMSSAAEGPWPESSKSIAMERRGGERGEACARGEECPGRARAKLGDAARRHLGATTGFAGAAKASLDASNERTRDDRNVFWLFFLLFFHVIRRGETSTP
jgi:hypothetical protein